MLDYLGQEWKTLQKSYDQYEFYSLMIKLFTIMLAFLSLSWGIHILLTCLFIAILWLQDAIWKTFQARIEVRLIKLESSIAKGNKQAEGNVTQLAVPFQFNRDFALSRQGLFGLIKEYLSTMLRPTIAYPYILLIILAVIFYFVSGAL